MTTKDKKIIEDSERDGIPIFVLTAKDRLSPDTIRDYFTLCHASHCNIDHLKNILDRTKEFENWQKGNTNKVKLPD
jgi:hypothetical protein